MCGRIERGWNAMGMFFEEFGFTTACQRTTRLPGSQNGNCGRPPKNNPTFLLDQGKAIDWDSLTASKMANQIWGFGEQRKLNICESLELSHKVIVGYCKSGKQTIPFELHILCSSSYKLCL